MNHANLLKISDFNCTGIGHYLTENVELIFTYYKKTKRCSDFSKKRLS